MARNVFIVNATQVITSEAHPEGLFSTVSGFPKTFDSFGGEEETALRAAKSAYFDQVGTNYGNSNPNRVLMTVTLAQADGRLILRDTIGAFPAEPEA